MFQILRLLFFQFGRLGHEERVMTMISFNGGLCIKILKGTADLSANNIVQLYNTLTTGNKFILPKKSKIFIEQSIRERSEAISMHTEFQKKFLSIRLLTSSKINNVNVLANDKKSLNFLQTSLFGINHNKILVLVITTVLPSIAHDFYYLICKCKQVKIKPKIIKLSHLFTNIPTFIKFTLKLEYNFPSNVLFLLCCKDQMQPLDTFLLTLPAFEESFM